MAETRVHDPATNFRFHIRVTGRDISAGFSKVTGLRDESESIEYREGTDPPVKRQIPGLRTFPAVTFERGLMVDATRLSEWREDAIACRPGFRSIATVTVHNCDGVAAREVVFEQAWPNGLQLADLEGGASEVNIETLELKHEGRPFTSIFQRGGVALPNRAPVAG